ncbi:Glyoxylase I 4 [Ancistrocladus abbreviatus]
MENPLRITSLNHVSIVCRSVEKSLNFYQNLLGFIPTRRPSSFNFDGAWLFNHGMGIHLLQSEDPDSMPPPISEINPKDNHISFQCESVANVEKKLKELKIKYVKSRVVEGGIVVDQLFFHDPDGLMIEICDCDNLPVVPLVGETIRSCARIDCTMQMQQQQQQQQLVPSSSHINYQKYPFEANTKCSVRLPLPSLLMLLDINFLP